MRPNIDIPDGLHGRIKEYKKSRGDVSTLDEAYIDIIEKGLQQVTLPSESSQSSERVSLSSKSGFFGVTAKHGSGINSSCLFTQRPPITNPVISQVTRTGGFDMDELRQLLAALKDMSGHRSYPIVTATFSQVNGEWYVGGVEDIYNAFIDTGVRWENTREWDHHRVENVTISAWLNGDTQIFITGENAPTEESGQGYLKNPSLVFVTEGHPTTGMEIREYADSLGFAVPLRSHEISIPSTMQTDLYTVDNGPLTIPTSEIKSVVSYTHSTGTGWVSGLVIENPFNREQLEANFRGTDFSMEDEGNELLSRDFIVASLLDHHPVDDESISGYRVERVRLSNLTEATKGRSGSIYDVGIDLRYIEE